ncbi:MAG TPA: toll/interleukin-1 receptor domain-containing protein [Steroidobacteraceae bacterium]|nr:toll/interleukin-1 receptor domain-containing protein [Steroidobacteraceae bacterium]
MADIFISYKREEAEHARRLAGVLETLGFSVWWDTALISGDQFRDVIREMITQCSAVVVLWSPQSVKSRFVVDEASYADRQNKLLPAILARCELPFGFGQHHADSLQGWTGQINHSGFQRLLRAIESRTGKQAQMGAGEPGSSPAQKREIAAFQMAASLRSAAAWNKFLEDYPGSGFRGFVETQLAELSSVGATGADRAEAGASSARAASPRAVAIAAAAVAAIAIVYAIANGWFTDKPPPQETIVAAPAQPSAPVEKKPVPAETKPAPVESKAMPVESKPVPVQKKPAPKPAATAPAPRTPDDIAWADASALNTEAAYRDYLIKFVSGAHRSQALEALDAIVTARETAKLPPFSVERAPPTYRTLIENAREREERALKLAAEAREVLPKADAAAARARAGEKGTTVTSDGKVRIEAELDRGTGYGVMTFLTGLHAGASWHGRWENGEIAGTGVYIYEDISAAQRFLGDADMRSGVVEWRNGEVDAGDIGEDGRLGNMGVKRLPDGRRLEGYWTAGRVATQGARWNADGSLDYVGIWPVGKPDY